MAFFSPIKEEWGQGSSGVMNTAKQKACQVGMRQLIPSHCGPDAPGSENKSTASGVGAGRSNSLSEQHRHFMRKLLAMQLGKAGRFPLPSCWSSHTAERWGQRVRQAKDCRVAPLTPPSQLKEAGEWAGFCFVFFLK